MMTVADLIAKNESAEDGYVMAVRRADALQRVLESLIAAMRRGAVSLGDLSPEDRTLLDAAGINASLSEPISKTWDRAADHKMRVDSGLARYRERSRATRIAKRDDVKTLRDQVATLRKMADDVLRGRVTTGSVSREDCGRRIAVALSRAEVALMDACAR